VLFLSVLFFFSCRTEKQNFDSIIRNGMIYDGSGNIPFKADVGINSDTIAFIGNLTEAYSKKRN